MLMPKKVIDTNIKIKEEYMTGEPDNVKIARVETKVDNLKESLDSLKTSQGETNAKLDAYMNQLDARYAGKWVETTVKGAVGVLVTGFMGLFIYLVEKIK